MRAVAAERTWDQVSRIAPDQWQALLDDADTVARYHRRVHKREPQLCWPWLGALSGSGHSRFRAGSRSAGPVPTRVVAGHIFGWQLSRGLLRPVQGHMPVIRHRCDESACHNPAHWLRGTRADNSADYRARVANPLSPLMDMRGARGRAVAIRQAVLQALADGADAEAAIYAAQLRGIRGVQDPLF
jgi:hypothetical protein